MVETWLTRLADWWGKWGIRFAASSSMVAHVVLALLAGTRRRNWCPGWTLLLWLAYQVLDIAGKYALAHLSLDDDTSREQLLVAFWTPFLLLHLGGPDNMGAYSLDDDKLSLRKAFEAVWMILGAWYVVYKNIYLGCTGVLRPASIIMLVVGAAKFLENVAALLGGDFGKIRGSIDKKKQPSSADDDRPVYLSFTSGGQEELDNLQALLFAHSQFQDCGRRVIADSSQEKDSKNLVASRNIFSLRLKDMYKVVEEEASYIYDVLYTKAAVVHTWFGYFLRLLSPFASATATSLFWLYPKDKCMERVDIIITYILLAAAFVLDVVSLVQALGSTWACAFLSARPEHWLHHMVLCRGWWHWLRRIAMWLHPCQLIGRDPNNSRMWSNTIGRYNLLQECTRRAPGCMAGLCSWLADKVGQENTWNDCLFWNFLSELPHDVKQLLFERIKQKVCSGGTTQGSNSADDAYPMMDSKTLWGQDAIKRYKEQFQGLLKLPSVGREFQEDVLLWHITTTIYLSSGDGAKAQQVNPNYAKAIEVVSEYLMFLLAARPYMLPGPQLRRLYEVTREALQEEWAEGGKENNSSCPAARKEKLAGILRRKEKSGDLDSDAKRSLLSDAARLAIALQDVPTKDVLQIIFYIWADKLLYAGIECSRESHARQLSRGGELTTMVWLVAEHAGLYRIGEKIQESTDDPDPPPPDPDYCNGEKHKAKKRCHDHPAGPVCPHVCCMKDYYYC